MVEMALILPIMVLLLVGIIDFGSLLFDRMTVINAARDGARYGATHSDEWRNEDGLTCAQVATNVATEVMARNTDTFTASNTTVAVTTLPANTCIVGSDISVTVTYVYAPIFPFWFGSGVDMSSTVQMRIE